MADESAIRDAFTQQAAFCRDMGSPLTADALEAARDALSRDTETGRCILDWEGDPTSAGDALPLRLAGGLHALARSGEDEALAAAYAGEGDVRPVVEQALAEHDAELATWLERPPQTNEAGRAAVVMAGLLVAANRYPLPIDLLELGSSAGLILNLPRYRFDLGGRMVGEETSPLLLAPEWKGAPPPDAPIDIVTQRGVDCDPIYLSTPQAAERLVAYIWADQRERIAIAERAIRLARAFTPPVIAGEGEEWVERRLAAPQVDGVLRVLFHTLALQYFSGEAQARVEAAVQKAGEAATEDRPFGHLSFELASEKEACELRLRLWPSDEELHLADAHFHGTWVKWVFEG